MGQLNDKRVLVTGCCGTVGGELVRQLLEDYAVQELVGLDNNESELFFMVPRNMDVDDDANVIHIRGMKYILFVNKSSVS